MANDREMPPPEDRRVTLRRDLPGHGIRWTNEHLRQLEKRGEFPKRFYLGPRTVAYWTADIEAWVQERAQASTTTTSERTSS